MRFNAKVFDTNGETSYTDQDASQVFQIVATGVCNHQRIEITPMFEEDVPPTRQEALGY